MGADHGMLPDRGVFLIGQLGILVDDVIRNADLADVMEQSHVVQLLFVVFVLAEQIRNAHRVIRDPL